MIKTLTNFVTCLLSNAVFMCSFIFLISAASLIMALIAEYIYGLEPCILCLYQRVPYIVTSILAFIGLAVLHKAERVKLTAALVFLCGIVFLIGGAIAFYHTGVEQHWWRSHLEGCQVTFDAGSEQDLMALIDAAPAVRCDEIPWADPVLGLSMAAYNTMMSFGLAVICALSALLIVRKANGILDVSNQP